MTQPRAKSCGATRPTRALTHRHRLICSMASSMWLSARVAIRNWISSVATSITSSPTDMVMSRSIRLEARQAMSQKLTLKNIAGTALLLLAVFAGVSAAQAQAIEQKVAVCKACHLTGALQNTSLIPNIWGQSERSVYIQLPAFKSGARNAPEDAAMRGFVGTMSDADMLEMATYASTQPWPNVR